MTLLNGLTGFGASTGSSFTPVTNTYFTGTAATETIPSGATQVVIKVYGGGGGGSRSNGGGRGGGAGGYSIKTYSLSGNAGQTFTYTVGSFGIGKQTTNGAGTNGGNSTVTNGTFPTATSITANGGVGSTSVASGGTASGGDTNVTGGVGLAGIGCLCSPVGGDGGSSNLGEFTGGIGGLQGGGGGAGGENGFDGSTDGGDGGRGKVVFAYT